MLQYKQLYRRGTENGAPSDVTVFQSQLSLNNFLNHWHVREEVLRKYSGIGQRTPSRNAESCGPELKGGRPVGGASFQDKSPFLHSWSQILIWDRRKHQFRARPRVLDKSFFSPSSSFRNI
jgi:hypothetical protein